MYFSYVLQIKKRELQKFSHATVNWGEQSEHERRTGVIHTAWVCWRKCNVEGCEWQRKGIYTALVTCAQKLAKFSCKNYWFKSWDLQRAGHILQYLVAAALLSIKLFGTSVCDSVHRLIICCRQKILRPYETVLANIIASCLRCCVCSSTLHAY